MRLINTELKNKIRDGGQAAIEISGLVLLVNAFQYGLFSYIFSLSSTLLDNQTLSVCYVRRV